MAAAKAEEVLTSIATPVDLHNREQLIKAATTSLSSKVVSSSSEDLAPLAVDAVLSVIDATTADNVDLNNVKIVKALGGTIDETELVPGLVFTNKVSHVAGAPTKVSGAKIGLIQFCLSAPKTDIEVGFVHTCVKTSGSGVIQQLWFAESGGGVRIHSNGSHFER
jgi:T-complex protein 1 subunit delta